MWSRSRAISLTDCRSLLKASSPISSFFPQTWLTSLPRPLLSDLYRLPGIPRSPAPLLPFPVLLFRFRNECGWSIAPRSEVCCCCSLGRFRLLVEKHHDPLIRVLYLFSDNCVKGVTVFLNLLVYFIVFVLDVNKLFINL